MNRQNILKTAIMLAATLLIAACTNDEMADSQPETLPEGMYPLTFTATQADIVASPQTRVTDSDEGGVHKSKWTAGDQIEVIVKGGGNDTKTTCTLKENGSIESYTPPVYWKTTQESTINAWYSNITKQNTTSSTVNLDDQSKGLAYVLADEVTGVKYNGRNISLNFKHQLAKVCVKLEKRIYEGDLSDATVKMKGCYTSCSVNNGAVTAGGTTGDITMHKAIYGNDTYYEANVVPGTTLKDEAFEISLNGKTTKANLKNGITLTKGNMHTITLAIDNKELTEITGGETINSPGDYIMTGTIAQTVTLNGNGINLILKDISVAITGQDKPAIEITGGSPVITVVGKNNVLSSSQWGGITMSNNANLTIRSADKNSNSLTVTAGDNGSHEASTVGIGVVQNGVCGNISISNVNLTVSGANSYACGGAAIGTSSISSTCGNITIADAIINATSGKGAAAIGLGCTATKPEPNEILKVSDIKITSSEITVILNPYYSTTSGDGVGYGAGIGMSIIWYGNFECGTITIDKKESELEGFSRNWKLNDPIVAKHSYKIGKGYEHDDVGQAAKYKEFRGVELNDKKLSDGWGKWSVP